ncbi:hypothetical protein HDE_08107 [Halotydeus destructor]|nr:hypothetical protein HDE_08107 [Halotydeus destructor]
MRCRSNHFRPLIWLVVTLCCEVVRASDNVPSIVSADQEAVPVTPSQEPEARIDRFSEFNGDMLGASANGRSRVYFELAPRNAIRSLTNQDLSHHASQNLNSFHDPNNRWAENLRHFPHLFPSGNSPTPSYQANRQQPGRANQQQIPAHSVTWNTPPRFIPAHHNRPSPSIQNHAVQPPVRGRPPVQEPFPTQWFSPGPPAMGEEQRFVHITQNQPQPTMFSKIRPSPETSNGSEEDEVVFDDFFQNALSNDFRYGSVANANNGPGMQQFDPFSVSHQFAGHPPNNGGFQFHQVGMPSTTAGPAVAKPAEVKFITAPPTTTTVAPPRKPSHNVQREPRPAAKQNYLRTNSVQLFKEQTPVEYVEHHQPIRSEPTPVPSFAQARKPHRPLQQPNHLRNHQAEFHDDKAPVKQVEWVKPEIQFDPTPAPSRATSSTTAASHETDESGSHEKQSNYLRTQSNHYRGPRPESSRHTPTAAPSRATPTSTTAQYQSEDNQSNYLRAEFDQYFREARPEQNSYNPAPAPSRVTPPTSTAATFHNDDSSSIGRQPNYVRNNNGQYVREERPDANSFNPTQAPPSGQHIRGRRPAEKAEQPYVRSVPTRAPSSGNDVQRTVNQRQPKPVHQQNEYRANYGELSRAPKPVNPVAAVSWTNHQPQRPENQPARPDHQPTRPAATVSTSTTTVTPTAPSFDDDDVQTESVGQASPVTQNTDHYFRTPELFDWTDEESTTTAPTLAPSLNGDGAQQQGPLEQPNYPKANNDQFFTAPDTVEWVEDESIRPDPTQLPSADNDVQREARPSTFKASAGHRERVTVGPVEPPPVYQTPAPSAPVRTYRPWTPTVTHSYRQWTKSTVNYGFGSRVNRFNSQRNSASGRSRDNSLSRARARITTSTTTTSTTTPAPRTARTAYPQRSWLNRPSRPTYNTYRSRQPTETTEAPKGLEADETGSIPKTSWLTATSSESPATTELMGRETTAAYVPTTTTTAQPSTPKRFGSGTRRSYTPNLHVPRTPVAPISTTSTTTTTTSTTTTTTKAPETKPNVWRAGSPRLAGGTQFNTRRQFNRRQPVTTEEPIIESEESEDSTSRTLDTPVPVTTQLSAETTTEDPVYLAEGEIDYD